MRKYKITLISSSVIIGFFAFNPLLLANDYQLTAGENTFTGLVNENIYSHPSAAMPTIQKMDFHLGNALFRRVWATGRGSARSSDGLGPLFNSRSCQRCHIKDGRGHPPAVIDEPAVSFVLQLNSAESDQVGDENYGKQVQPFAVPGIEGEANVTVNYEDVSFKYPDGEIVSLLKPNYNVRNLKNGGLAKATILSPRVAPQMIGLGLIGAISEQSILKHADPEDANNDGISGRANYGYSLLHRETKLSRFGWKASAPTIEDQVAAAFATDMGLSTPLINADYGDCTSTQQQCQEEALRTDDLKEDSEIKPEMFKMVTFYSANLSVPKSRHPDEKSYFKGKALFEKSDCIACHVSSFTTQNSDKIASHFRNQTIWPYSDLLLHDMGEGLADLSRSGFAGSTEWRTAPLWGVGLAKIVNEKAKFLHDGRARTIEEAILWHGGEASSSHQKFIHLPKKERIELIMFIKNL